MTPRRRRRDARLAVRALSWLLLAVKLRADARELRAQGVPCSCLLAVRACLREARADLLKCGYVT